MNVIQIFGPKSSGKTTLLIQTATAYIPQYADYDAAAKIVRDRQVVRDDLEATTCFWDEFMPEQATEVPQVSTLFIATQERLTEAEIKACFGSETVLAETIDLHVC